MDEENWRRITTRFIALEDSKNVSTYNTYKEENEMNQKVSTLTKLDMASKIASKKPPSQVGGAEAENCNEDCHENLVKSMGNESLRLRQPLVCDNDKHVQKPKNIENNAEFISARDIKRLKQTLEVMKNDLKFKEKIIQDKTETIDKLERQMVAIANQRSLLSLKRQQKSGLVLPQPPIDSVSMNLFSARMDEEAVSVNVNPSRESEVHSQQNEILQAIVNRLDGLEKRIEEAIKSIAKEIQSSVEAYLASRRFKCNESQQSFSVCSITNSESKPKPWNKNPIIQPRSNLSSNMRFKLHNCNNVNGEDLIKGPSLCFCQSANLENCQCKSTIEMQISSMEKVVTTLKSNFMNLFKKTTARRYLERKKQ